MRYTGTPSTRRARRRVQLTPSLLTHKPFAVAA